MRFFVQQDEWSLKWYLTFCRVLCPRTEKHLMLRKAEEAKNAVKSEKGRKR